MAKETQAAGKGAGDAQFEVNMEQDRQTKNAVRFQEVHEKETDPDRIGQLYVQKSAFAAHGKLPERIKVVVSVLSILIVATLSGSFTNPRPSPRPRPQPPVCGIPMNPACPGSHGGH